MLPPSACYLLHVFFDPEDGDMFLQNVGCLSNGLRGVISQKTELFITSKPTTHKISAFWTLH
jgi:hypothetical protein